MFCGFEKLNSMDVKVYSALNLTKEQKYLDFATYIVESGFTFNQNIIDLCIEGKVEPWQFQSTKAYEMTSCFEGLLEYYYATGIEKYKTAVINFANNVGLPITNPFLFSSFKILFKLVVAP